MAGKPEPWAIVEFGRFKVLRRTRELLADGQPIELGGRAFDALVALLDARGMVVDRDRLMSLVWPDRVVEEHNLHAQISALRRALGADRHLIQTVSARGYQFTGEIRETPVFAAQDRPPRRTNVPEAVSELIGREGELRDVTTLLTQSRLVTLVGAGGIGKTRLGLEVARQLLSTFADGVFVAELGPLSSPDVVPATVATALGLTLAASRVSGDGIAAAVGGNQLLVVLDNCEHVILAAAGIVETLLHGCPAVSVLVTSREPLRVSGEAVYRVPPLAVPTEGHQGADDFLRYAAVKLFASRAQAVEPRYALDARVAATTSAICRHLDGIPLAIELAAGRIPGFGVEGVAAALRDRFRLLTGGSRTALPRHQTMHATLDWSHELLSEAEQVVLRRLAVFAGDFSLEAAGLVATSADISSQDVGDCVDSLVAKSLLSTDVLGATVRYRLLETTRAYAREKLAASGELEQSARRHAEYHRELFTRAEAESETRAAADWLATYRPHIDNLRAALDWAFSSGGDATTAVTLTAAAIPLWMHLALVAECRARVEEALTRVDGDVPAEPRRDMRLFLALGISGLTYTQDPERSRMIAALTKALQLAEQVGDSQYCLRAMWGLYISCFRAADYRNALSLAERFRAVAARTLDPFDDLIGERLIGIVLHVLGDQRGALQRIAPLVSADFTTDRQAHILRFQYDQRVVTHCHYSKIVWLHGRPDQALHVAERIVDHAQTNDHVLSLLYALVQGACAISLYRGDFSRLERYGELVRGLAARHGLEAWRTWARAFEGALLIKRGDAAAGARLLDAALKELPPGALYLNTNLSAELAGGFAATGQIGEGLALIDDTLAHVDRTEEGWCRAELLRTKGELLLCRRERTGLAEAESCLRQALDVAHQQGALAWELRAATSLARLGAAQGRTGQARAVLAPVYDRFTEGFETGDLAAAQTLLSSLL